jgi:hypothetical protein
MDSTFRLNIKPTDTVGSQFEPFNVPDRDFLVRQPLPPTPLQLFKVFLSEHIVERWVSYSNKAAAAMPEPAEGSRDSHWSPTDVDETYLWIGIRIYMTLHRDFQYEDLWKAPIADEFDPLYPVIQFMPFDRFILLQKWFRTYDPDCIEVGAPTPFNTVNEWSNYMIEAAVSAVETGSVIGVDEAIVGFKGRSRHKITIKAKPTPTGLKVWALAAQGYLLESGKAQTK